MKIVFLELRASFDNLGLIGTVRKDTLQKRGPSKHCHISSEILKELCPHFEKADLDSRVTPQGMIICVVG